MLATFDALRFPRYRAYFLASLASVGGTQLVMLAQAWLVFELSGSALQLGYLGAAASIPNIAMSLFGGVLADRFDKRRLLMLTSALTALLLFVLAVLDLTGLVRVWHVLLIAAGVALIQGIDWPARVSVFPALIDREFMMSAVALNSVVWQVTRMAMPALGGLLMAATDTWVLFALGGGGALVMTTVMAAIGITIPGTASESAIRQVSAGFRFIFGTPLFRSLLLLSYVGTFFGSSYTQIMPAFAALLEAGETGYGYLISAGGVGSMLGTLAVSNLQRHPQLGWVMLGCSAASALSLMGFAWLVALGGPTLVFLAALALVTVAALFASMFMISSMTVLQLTVPDHLRGRVMGIHAITYSMIPLGGLFVGALASASSPVIALVLSASAYLALVVAVALLLDVVRGIDGTRLPG